MPQHEELAIGVSDLEIAVVGRLPAVDDVGNLDLTSTEPKASWRLLGAIARIAFHFNQPRCGRVIGTCFVHFAVPSIVVPTRIET